MTKIKICGLTSPKEAAYLNEIHADFAGFVLFYPKSKRNISIAQAKEIFHALDSEIRKVAVVVSPTPEQISQIEAAGFDFIQIHGTLTKKTLHAIHLPILKAFNVSDMEQYKDFHNEDKIKGYVFDAVEPGSGRTFDWNLVKNVPRDEKFLLLAGGLDAENVADAIKAIKPDAVDVSSGVEFTDGTPGKDPRRIRAFAASVRQCQALHPKEVFSYFEEICSIPHGSSNTRKISDYLVNFAISHHLRYQQDHKNNVIIWKNGTPGYENSAPVMLQGHMDMVCEKEADCEIDFSTDGLTLEITDGIISAKGTTLGGDDGIALAYALAILAGTDIPHPPLEAVFTVDEEIGMLGAAALDCTPLKSRIMLNLDSEDEGHLLVSCAGGITVTGHLPLTFETLPGYSATLTVDGLQGGHSGIEIDKGRANACILLGRALYLLHKQTGFRLQRIDGGLKDNAIPRRADAVLHFLSMEDAKKALALLEQLQHILQQEYALTDAAVKIGMTNSLSSTSQTMDETTTQKVITALYTLPDGIQKMSRDIEGLVQTSLNLGILKTEASEVIYSFAARSSVESEKAEMVDRITCLMEELGGSVSTDGAYPAWEYRKESPLRELMVRIYREQYGKAPVIEALHAGVECGLFAGKLPGLDCVSFGPDIKNIHTPKESMEVESVARTWNYLLEILKELR